MYRQTLPRNWKLVAALGAVYFIWGSTYLAIKVAVAALPPVFAAGVRFLAAGSLLYTWSRVRGAAAPSREQWPRIWLLAALMFFTCYSILFWAEETVPSGIASVLVAMLPAWTLILELAVLKTQRLTPMLVAALTSGFLGVALLTAGARTASGAVPWLPCAGILVSEIAWATASILSKKFTLPESLGISAGAQMLCGGCLIMTLSVLLGEWHDLRPVPWNAVFAMLYLIVAGSLIAFYAYLWLLSRMSPTTVSSYAYVNPIVALALGYFLADEKLDASAIAGAALVIASVILILKQRGAARPEAHEMCVEAADK